MSGGNVGSLIFIARRLYRSREGEVGKPANLIAYPLTDLLGPYIECVYKYLCVVYS